MFQSTLAGPAKVSGVGLFTGKPCQCVIGPAKVDHGITFILDSQTIPVRADAINHKAVHPAFAGLPPRCSAVEHDGTTVWLVEHILSALTGLGVTNAVIKINHCELPILDGSSRGFVEAIIEAGIAAQDQKVQWINIEKPIRVEQGDAWIEIVPDADRSYEYSIDYGSNSPIAKATVEWNGRPDQYTQTIGHARTFCLKSEADAMIQSGLFGHINQGDMLVFDDSGPVDNPLRHEHECAYHKLLDLIGDVALIGRPVKGRIRAHKSGHVLAHRLANAIVDAQ